LIAGRSPARTEVDHRDLALELAPCFGQGIARPSDWYFTICQKFEGSKRLGRTLGQSRGGRLRWGRATRSCIGVWGQHRATFQAQGEFISFGPLELTAPRRQARDRHGGPQLHASPAGRGPLVAQVL